MEEYKQKFPELFINLSKLADQKRFQPEQIFSGPNPETKITEVAGWLKKMPYQNARRMKFDAEALDEIVVKCIEDVLDSHKVFSNQFDPITLVYSTNQLYRPANIIGHSPPDSNASFNLFNRVVNVREGISVPLGARGVIIGKTKDKLDDDTYLCDIVFDEPFIGGLSLNCSAGRGYRLHPFNLINISYKKKNGNYGAHEEIELAPIQPARSEHKDKKPRQKISPGPKKLINLSPNRNHERHEYSLKRDYLDQDNQNIGHNYNHSNFNYHNDHRNNNNGKQPTISSPIQINHSPRSLFQSPKEMKNNNNTNFVKTGPTSILTRIKNKESSPAEERNKHTMKASSGSPASGSSAPKSYTGHQFMQMMLAEEQNKGTARATLDEWSRVHFGKEPVYKQERIGPSNANKLVFSNIQLPNNQKFCHPVNPSESPSKMYENVALKAIRELKISNVTGVPPPFEPPASILPPPPPPLTWIEQLEPDPPIPASFVAENQRIIQNTLEQRKQNAATHQNKINSSRSPVAHQYQQQQQQQQHHQYQQQSQHPNYQICNQDVPTEYRNGSKPLLVSFGPTYRRPK